MVSSEQGEPQLATLRTELKLLELISPEQLTQAGGNPSAAP